MTAISQSTFSFLQALKGNNYRAWFKENKAAYDDAHKNFIDFIDALIKRISKFDPSIEHNQAKNCVFRIYRDVRFSKDKSPYKTNFGAHITPASKRSELHSRAGYYIHLEPGKSMLAGGAYLPQKVWLKGIRKQIAENGDELRQILNAPGFKKYFGEMTGDQLKTSPRDYPKDHPEIELLRYKSFLAVHPCKDQIILAEDFLDHASRVYKAMHPFDQFLNRATQEAQ